MLGGDRRGELGTTQAGVELLLHERSEALHRTVGLHGLQAGLQQIGGLTGGELRAARGFDGFTDLVGIHPAVAKRLCAGGEVFRGEPGGCPGDPAEREGRAESDGT